LTPAPAFLYPHSSAALRPLLSFPTRRSSDLYLHLMEESIGVEGMRTPVDIGDDRVFPAFIKVRRLHEPAVHFSAVVAFETDVLRIGKLCVFLILLIESGQFFKVPAAVIEPVEFPR